MIRTALLLYSALAYLPALGAGPVVRDGLPVIAAAELPAEARDTLRVIKRGGPFPYDRDGAEFKNYERVLPGQARGCTSDTLLTKSAACGRRCEAGAPAPKGSTPPCRARYREYTVKTPGVRNRGGRRIVCGGPLPEGNSGKGSERDEAQGVRSFAWPIDYGWKKTPAESLVSGATDTYHDGRRVSEHRTTLRFARAATSTEFPECYYSADHYRTFKLIRDQP